MMRSPSPEDDNAAPRSTQLRGQLSFDDLTHELMEALGAGEWTLLVDDPQGREG